MNIFFRKQTIRNVQLFTAARAFSCLFLIFLYKNLHFESFVISAIIVLLDLLQNSIVPCINALYLLYDSVVKQYLRYVGKQTYNMEKKTDRHMIR